MTDRSHAERDTRARETELEAGRTFEVAYPFIRAPYTYMDDEGPVETEGWKPGVRFEDMGEGDVESLADARGRMRLTVVSIHKPGKFPTRVFCTRRFVDPDGREFGKGKLHIMTVEKFRRLSSGYQHEYRLPNEESRWAAQQRFYRELQESSNG